MHASEERVYGVGADLKSLDPEEHLLARMVYIHALQERVIRDLRGFN